MELRAKGADKEEPELETCFEALYGILLLKLQKKEISEETRKAQEAISTLLAMLSNYYIEDKKRRIGILINEIEMKNILVTGANGQLGNEMRVLSAEYKEYT